MPTAEIVQLIKPESDNENGR